MKEIHMNNCKSECDCDGPDKLLGIDHAPDCHSRRTCDDGLYCDKHFEEAAEENRRVLRSPIGARCGGSMYGHDEDAMRQDMIDAGRGHLLPDVLADRIDMARMRLKDGQ